MLAKPVNLCKTQKSGGKLQVISIKCVCVFKIGLKEFLHKIMEFKFKISLAENIVSVFQGRFEPTLKFSNLKIECERKKRKKN